MVRGGRASRLTKVLAGTIGTAMVLAASAAASVTPAIDLTLSNTQLGAHADATVQLDFDYGGDCPMLYPPPSDYRESVKNLVVDIPPGLVGNPNAIPMAERCDPVVFETSVCPDSATVGEFTISVGLQQAPPAGPTSTTLDIIPITTTGVGGMATKLSLIKTGKDVPAKIGIYVHPPLNNWADIRQTIQIEPDRVHGMEIHRLRERALLQHQPRLRSARQRLQRIPPRGQHADSRRIARTSPRFRSRSRARPR